MSKPSYKSDYRLQTCQISQKPQIQLLALHEQLTNSCPIWVGIWFFESQ